MKNFDRKLYRSSNQAWLGGVCAGVAECYGQPVWLIRILMITLFVLAICNLWLEHSDFQSKSPASAFSIKVGM